MMKKSYSLRHWVIGLLGLLAMQGQAWAEAMKLEQVAEGIYVHHGVHEDLSEGYQGDICNISFVIGDKGIAVIDSGGSFRVGQRFREAIRRITDLPILYVINTHVHPDHIYGNAAFTSAHTTFVGHAKLADAMELRREPYQRMHRDWMGAAFDGSEMIKPTILVDRAITLDLGGRTLELTAHPAAHTNTDLTIKDDKTDTFWTGDLLFVERTPSIDGDLKGWIRLTETLMQQPAKLTIPGHGPVVADGIQAFKTQYQYLTTLLNDIRASIKKGEMMEQAMDTAAASERDRWVLFDVVNRRNVNLVYPGLEWE